MLRKILAVIVGALLYILLNWIVILGSIASGFAAGWVARCSSKCGFLIGALSAALGFCVFLYVMKFTSLAVDTLLDFLLFWMFIIWNLVGFLFAGIGGILGSMLYKPMGPLSKIRGSGGSRKSGIEPKVDVYVICPNCGFSNSEENEYCKSCGTKLVG